MLRIHSKNVFSHFRGTKTVRPLSTASIAAPRRGSSRRNTIGRSATARSPRPSGRRRAPSVAWSSIFATRPCSLEIGDDALARGEPVDAAIGFGRRVVEPRVAVEDVDERQAVAPADLEIVEVVRRRDLDRAAAGRGIGILVGDDGNAAADQRQDRVTPDEMRDSARPRDAPRRRYRPAWSRAASSRR